MPRMQRSRDRFPVAAKVHISWTNDQGAACFTTGQIVDISQSGAKLELNDRVPVRTFVTFQSQELGLHGTASVRYCITHKLKYRAGVEFSGGLRWDQPPE